MACVRPTNTHSAICGGQLAGARELQRQDKKLRLKGVEGMRTLSHQPQRVRHEDSKSHPIIGLRAPPSADQRDLAWIGLPPHLPRGVARTALRLVQRFIQQPSIRFRSTTSSGPEYTRYPRLDSKPTDTMANRQLARDMQTEFQARVGTPTSHIATSPARERETRRSGSDHEAV